jgi:hypothetical protein
MALPDIHENGILMVFEPHHKLIDPCVPKTVQKVLIPDDEIGP